MIMLLIMKKHSVKYSVFRDKVYLHHMRMLKLLSSPLTSHKKVKQTLKYINISKSVDSDNLQ